MTISSGSTGVCTDPPSRTPLQFSTFSTSQKDLIGRILLANIDGVTRDVLPLLNALNDDVASGIKIVAASKWERCQIRLQVLQRLLADLEVKIMELTRGKIASRLRGPTTSPMP